MQCIIFEKKNQLETFSDHKRHPLVWLVNDLGTEAVLVACETSPRRVGEPHISINNLSDITINSLDKLNSAMGGLKNKFNKPIFRFIDHDTANNLVGYTDTLTGFTKPNFITRTVEITDFHAVMTKFKPLVVDEYITKDYKLKVNELRDAFKLSTTYESIEPNKSNPFIMTEFKVQPPETKKSVELLGTHKQNTISGRAEACMPGTSSIVGSTTKEIGKLSDAWLSDDLQSLSQGRPQKKLKSQKGGFFNGDQKHPHPETENLSPPPTTTTTSP